MSTTFNDDDELLVQENHITVDPEPAFGRLGITLDHGNGSATHLTPDAADDLGHALIAAAEAYRLGIEVRS